MVSVNIRRSIYKRFLIFIFIFSFVFVLSSCLKEPEYKKQNVETQNVQVFPEEFKGKLIGKKLYFTNIGQSSEYTTFVNNIYKDHFENEYTADNLLDPSTVPEGSVVFLFIGGSVKSLAELGLTVGSENDRLDEFIELKKQGEIELYSFHLGGTKRRGNTSDGLITKAFSNSDFNIFVKDGDFDLMMTSISSNNNVPCYSIDRVVQLFTVMRLLTTTGDVYE